MVKGYKFRTDFAEKWSAFIRDNPLPPGLLRIYIDWFTMGYTERAARDVLTVLQARGLAVSDEVRERILAEEDSERLKRCLEKAAVASSVDEVVESLVEPIEPKPMLWWTKDM